MLTRVRRRVASRLRRNQWFHLSVHYNAPDAVTAERAHDDACNAICSGGQDPDDEHVHKYPWSASVPIFDAHERVGRPYYLDITFFAPNRAEASWLREC